MMLRDLGIEIYSAITVNKARSGLTMLGIIVGIASVISMVAIGQGAQDSITQSIQSIGANLIIVSPGVQQRGSLVSAGRGTAESLTRKDADAIAEKVENVQAISPEVSRRYQITAKGTNTSTQVVGVIPAYMSVRNVEMAEGLFVTEDQVSRQAKVAVLGPTTRDDLFGVDSNAIGQTIRVNNVNFRVVGITKPKGGSSFTNQDDIIFVPLSTATQFLTGSQYLSTIGVQAINADALTTVQEDITTVLLQQHKIAEPELADFSTLNQADIVAAASSATGTFTILLAAIASISLLVGGIGIMNMMLTSVTERTKEIGLRKAIGATSRDISRQFLGEALILTFLGGVIGLLLGLGIATGVSSLFGITASVSLSSIFLAFGVSSAIGIVFGYYPARRASLLNPIEALRYE